MKKQVLNQKEIGILAIFVIAFMVFGVLLWYRVSTPDEVLPAAPKAPVVESVDLESADSNTTTEVVENLIDVIDVPTHPLAIGESIGVPVRIHIPNIALNAALEKVALTTDGLMDVPKYPLNAGWYILGPRPGEIGSAAIAGHVDWPRGSAGVFANLHKVKPGDTLSVQDDKGALISFVVRESRMYDAAADATDVFSSSDGKAHLNLITCDGDWDEQAQQYSQRLVVFTDLLSDEQAL